MIRRDTLLLFMVPSLLASACGAAPPPAAPPPAETAAAAAPTAKPVQEEKPVEALPTACAGERSDKLCVPPAAFVKRLCAGFFPDVALTMLGKGTPWTRGYLRVKSVNAWNASGGVSSNDKIVFDEEFVILTHREENAGGIVVSGSTGAYDVLRWDGTCASLTGEEVTTRTPPAPKHAKIPWRSLDDKVRDALLASEKISKVASERKKECKGATIGEVSNKCEKADAMLSVVVVDYVRGGGALPPPSKLP